MNKSSISEKNHQNKPKRNLRKKIMSWSKIKEIRNKHNSKDVQKIQQR